MRLIALLIIALSASAAEWRVDESGSWSDISASHHDKHLLGGVVIGAAGYATAACFTERRLPRYAVAVGAGAIVGLSYEIAHGSDTTVIDPVDACWVAAGSFVGAVLTDVADQALEISANLHHRGAAVAVAWRF